MAEVGPRGGRRGGCLFQEVAAGLFGARAVVLGPDGQV